MKESHGPQHRRRSRTGPSLLLPRTRSSARSRQVQELLLRKRGIEDALLAIVVILALPAAVMAVVGWMPWAALHALDGQWGITAVVLAVAYLVGAPVAMFWRRAGWFVGSSWAVYGLWSAGYWKLLKKLGTAGGPDAWSVNTTPFTPAYHAAHSLDGVVINVGIFVLVVLIYISA